MACTSVGRSAFYVYFKDRYQLIEALLKIVQEDFNQAAFPWFQGTDDPVAALYESLTSVINLSVVHGPILRAVSEAAPLDTKLEALWTGFMTFFDEGVEAAIIRDQKAGKIGNLNPRETSFALNCMNINYLIQSFGKNPQANPKTALNTLFGIWRSALFAETEIHGQVHLERPKSTKKD